MKMKVDIPPPDKLVKGRVYKLRCRNLAYGVWDGETGFIGIREKFGNRYLDHETHWDLSVAHGTVSGAEDTGVDVPEGTQLKLHTGHVDSTGRDLDFDKSLPNPMGWSWPGWYRFSDTGELCPKYKEGDPQFQYYLKGNAPLFEFLEKFEKEQDDGSS